jgi:hypothetical protein
VATTYRCDSCGKEMTGDDHAAATVANFRLAMDSAGYYTVLIVHARIIEERTGFPYEPHLCEQCWKSLLKEVIR